VRIAIASLIVLGNPLSGFVWGSEPTDESGRIDIGRLKAHVATLASDSLEGRQAGSRGGKAASAYLVSELKKLELTPAGTSGQWFQEFGSEWRNVLALIPGSDPQRSRELIVVGAHYDHVGYGNAGNSRGPFGYVHNGADDNASGTAALLEIAKGLAARRSKLQHSVLIAFWDAEESGLHGATHWRRVTTLPEHHVQVSVNLDMVGRLRQDRVRVMGWRSAPGLRETLCRANDHSTLWLDFQQTVTADSDHWPFYSGRVPALSFDTDKHDDYHRPSDDADKIEYEGVRRIGELAIEFVASLAAAESLPGFRNECFNEPAADYQPTNAAPLRAAPRVGFAWDPALADQSRLVVTTTTPGSPAANAGFQAGDELLSLGSWRGSSVDDLRTAICVAVNPVPFTLKRPERDEPIRGTLTLNGQASRFGMTWKHDPAQPATATVWSVIAFSPADRAGLKAGDVLMRFHGRPITDEATLRGWLAEQPGPLQLEIERQGRRLKIVAPLYDQPVE
jgi:hypothetical protein